MRAYCGIIRDMWIQIILSILLAVVAVRVIMYAARHDLVPVLTPGEDFVVRMPRIYLLVGVVLFILAGSFVLSMIVWSSAEPMAVVGTAAVAVIGLWFVLRGAVWRIEVHRKYLIFVSVIGVKRLVHYEDIESARLGKKGLSLTTLIRTYKANAHAVYLEDFLQRLADERVPVYRD